MAEITNVKFTLEVDSGNAAVVADPSVAVVEMLRKVADRVLGAETEGSIRDANGNHVGEWKLITETGPEEDKGWDVQGDYGHGDGFETLTAEATKEKAEETMRLYQREDSQPARYRVRKAKD